MENNMGIINIIRLKSFVGMAIKFKILVDNIDYGDLKNNSSLNINVNYGHHHIIIKTFEKSIPIEVTLNDNQKEVEICCKSKMGFLVARPKIISIIYR